MDSLTSASLTNASKASRGISAIALFLIFLLGFVIPAISARPAPQVAVTSQGAVSNPTSNQSSSEVCAEALVLANNIDTNFIARATGTRGQLEDVINKISSVVGTRIYTGPDQVKRSLSSIRIAAQGATSPQRTQQELTSEGLSSRLNTESVKTAIADIYSLCR